MATTPKTELRSEDVARKIAEDRELIREVRRDIERRKRASFRNDLRQLLARTRRVA
jgi:hypothetical protein